MSRRLLLRAFCAFVVASLAPFRVAAQEIESAPAHSTTDAEASSRGTTERRAVRLGHDALALYEASRWDEAYARFETAEQLVHSPVFLLYMARCRRNAGRLLEAAERLERLSVERVAEDAPAAWHGAIADASAELIALRRAIPRIVVVVRGAPNARVSLDGRELSTTALGKPLAVDPGRHALIARDSNGRQVVRSFQVAEGQPTTVVDASFSTTSALLRDRKPPTGDSASVWRTAGYVLLGVGAAGLGAGLGAAVVASRDSSRDTDDWATWSTAGLVAGGAVAGAGVLLLLLHPSGGL
jgi:hypothetical protein